ncbi:phosphoribosylanthranilate isomerase [Aestuariirhabdus litorea]|uniref:N-(5'-phosphoribosyl)anthranilate isomerase n=1 Tax=Aestuariirhabdus litorea TaxID=2528527 RepID=A0A3P3VR39_9GAMM|nr:phosphoribosylanthranilate isomerase [Aestuariirhabdus litorea]RRJ84924.1 phosphoribosylanthranilate isomerase [Aestuariirhabdus litorea]RWW98149.1 phosphoribosylanthranilate isomerase [Endozoicomonadaceae bacterium GTF-13]
MSAARVKVCGITRLEDALVAISAGVQALGFVFYPPSPRYISPVDAAGIIQQLPPFVTTVGLFVDASVEEVESAIALTQLDLLQFHGNEPADYCGGFSRPYIKALRVKGPEQIVRDMALYPDARGLLLDTYKKGVPGGTGETFNWEWVPASTRCVILAGGLNANNVGQAITAVMPYAVDVSGGVEAAPGIKDHSKILAFMSEVASVRD